MSIFNNGIIDANKLFAQVSQIATLTVKGALNSAIGLKQLQAW